MENKIIWIIGLIVSLAITGYLILQNHTNNKSQTPLASPAISTQLNTIIHPLTEPISSALARVTKKPFGIFVSPGNSPASPERFTGYHTGTDFETLPSEANVAVAIYAICDGPLLEKITAIGYGGVMVQGCQLGSQSITVIYGHIKLTSVTARVGQKLVRGNQIAILGQGYSSETGGERKQLHLGIHKGNSINILGYVQNINDLSNWLNVVNYIK